MYIHGSRWWISPLLHFGFSFPTLDYFLLKKKKKTNQQQELKKKKTDQTFRDSAEFFSDNSLSCLSQFLFAIPAWVCHIVLCWNVCVCVCVASLSLLHILYWEYKQESCWLLLWTVSLGATSRLSILSQVIEWNWSTHSTRRGSWLNLFPGQVISSRMGM